MASRKPHSRNDSRISVEPLETRDLRSVTLKSTGVFELVGSTAVDYFAIEVISPTQLEVRTTTATPRGAGAPFDLASVTSVLVKLDASADTLITLPSIAPLPAFAAPMTVFADLTTAAASGGCDKITTGSGNDTVYGYGGGDIINTGDGDDVVYGFSPVGTYSTTTLYQDADVIDTGAGRDKVYGGPDVDEITGGADSDTLYGNEKNDTLYGGTGADTLDGGSENDTLSGDDGDDVILGAAGTVSINGGSGMDNISGEGDVDTINGGDGDDKLDGGSSGDTINGDNGSDYIFGNLGADSITGGDGNDVIDGGTGNDTVEADAGDDSVTGGSGHDSIFGGTEEDLIEGGDGDDYLFGDEDNDLLRGDAGKDTLSGDDGLDGLFGGHDGVEDSLSGGDDPDRFLNPYTGGSVIGQNWEDDVMDKTSDDARIGFKDDGNWTVHIGGVAYPYGPGTWSDSEIEQVDAGLMVLHHATGNKQLLEQKHGNEIEFLRNGADSSGVEPAGAINDGGQIHMLDVTFAGTTPLWVVEVTLHGVGHYWDEEYDDNGWEELSGWERSPSDTSGMTQSSGGWWYDTSEAANFVSNYAMGNPEDDFAESFANYFMNLAGLTFQGDAGGQDISLIDSKSGFLDDLFASMAALPRSAAPEPTVLKARVDPAAEPVWIEDTRQRSGTVFSAVEI